MNVPTFVLLAVVAAAFCALANRYRGGWQPPLAILRERGHTQRRILVAIFVAGSLFAASSSPLVAGAGLLTFFGLILPWAAWQDQGRVTDDDDLTGMSGRGLLLHLPTAAWLGAVGEPTAGLVFVALGSLMGPAYGAAWAVWTGFGLRLRGPLLRWSDDRDGPVIDGPTAIGELLTGANLGLAAVVAGVLTRST